jgi:hypothetical protein
VLLSPEGALNQQVADLVAAADRIQHGDPALRRELAGWIRPNFTKQGDGMTGASFGFGDLASAVGPWATRALDLGRFRAARDRNLCLEAPLLMVIHSEDTVSNWREVGELLEVLLLVLTKNSLQFSFFNMLIEVPEIRTRLKGLLNLPAWPQLLLRVGYSLNDTSPSPRRPLDDVMVHSLLKNITKA